MARCLVLVFFIIGSALASEKTAVDVISDIYSGCLQHFSVSCVKPRALSWISAVQNQDVIQLTDDLAIRRTGFVSEEQSQRSTDSRFEIFDQVEDFLSTHELHAKVPAALRPDGPLGSFVPRALTPEDVSIPFSEARSRGGLMRKVIIPFLLGLKFKTGVLVPLGLALIALKTWKALTLGLLSLVLSGAMLIFKFTKPKIINYEVIHYPHHHDHHIDHPPPAGWEHPGYGRSFNPESENLAYRAYV